MTAIECTFPLNTDVWNHSYYIYISLSSVNLLRRCRHYVYISNDVGECCRKYTKLLAFEIVERLEVLVDDAKAGALMVVLEDIPECMRLRKGTASHALPVGSSASDRRNRFTSSWAAYRPACLGDPDPSAGLDRVDHTSSRLDALPEDVVAILARSVLEVWITICPHEVAGFDGGLVLGVDPCRPGVHVANLDLASPHRPQHSTDVVDLVCQNLGAGIFTVEILAANRNADDPVVSIFFHSSQQSLFLGIKVRIVLFQRVSEVSTFTVCNVQTSVQTPTRTFTPLALAAGTALASVLQSEDA